MSKPIASVKRDGHETILSIDFARLADAMTTEDRMQLVADVAMNEQLCERVLDLVLTGGTDDGDWLGGEVVERLRARVFREMDDAKVDSIRAARRALKGKNDEVAWYRDRLWKLNHIIKQWLPMQDDGSYRCTSRYTDDVVSVSKGDMQTNPAFEERMAWASEDEGLLRFLGVSEGGE
jgi:hypothetical protein